MLKRRLVGWTTALAVVTLAVATQRTCAAPRPTVLLQEKKEEPKLYKGQLRPNWKKLGLSDKQVQAIYKVQTEHREQIDKLEAQIKKLRDDMLTKELEVLTDAQKTVLKDLMKKGDK